MELSSIFKKGTKTKPGTAFPMVSSTGNNPPIDVLRYLFSTVSTIQINGLNESAKEIAYQLMNIIEVRHQEANGLAMKSTFDVIWKIYKSTDGHVTPKDVNIFLRQPSEIINPKTISDEGLFNVGLVLWEEKKIYWRIIFFDWSITFRDKDVLSLLVSE